MNGNGLKWIAGTSTVVIGGLLLAILIKFSSIPEDIAVIKSTLTTLTQQVETNAAHIDRLRGWTGPR